MSSAPQNKKFGKLFLSAGAMKCGTTTLFQILKNHPDLHFTPEKEIHYLHHLSDGKSSFLDIESREARYYKYTFIPKNKKTAANIIKRSEWMKSYYSETIDDEWYAKLFYDAKDSQYWCDFSNLTCFATDNVWHDLKEKSQALKVLYTMRSPLDRLWSHTCFELTKVEKRDFAELSPLDLETMAMREDVMVQGEYGQVITKLKRNLSDQSLYIQFYEDAFLDLANTIRSIELFLGIQPYQLSNEKKELVSNATPSGEMPDWFREKFLSFHNRIVNELLGMGLTPPETWHQPT